MKRFSEREILLFALIIVGIILPIVLLAMDVIELLPWALPFYYLMLIVSFLSIWVFLKRIRSMKELDQLKNIFLVSMNHELKTPLTSIIGFTKMMLKGRVGEINEEQEKQLKIILNSANHLHELINDAIDVNKIEANKVDISKNKFDLVEELFLLKESFNIAIEKNGLEFLIDTPEIVIINNDKKRIKQILVNLIGNAIKFTENGHIALKILKLNGEVKISVEDTGLGIKKEDQEKLFKPFSRIIESGRYKEGTGLGLYLSKKLAKLLNGNIFIESEFGKGSTFTLLLKLDEEKI